MILDVIGTVGLVMIVVLALMLIEREYFTFVSYLSGVVVDKTYVGYGEWEIVVQSGSLQNSVLTRDVIERNLPLGSEVDVVLTVGQYSGKVYDKAFE